jgi:hypothetical protein
MNSWSLWDARHEISSLARGRLTRPDRLYLILHGNDSPIGAWKQAVIRGFNLQGQRVRPIFDEHEQQLPDDALVVAKIFGPFRTFAERDTASTGP